MSARLTILSLLIFSFGCQRGTPEQSDWKGQLLRSDGKNIPFQFYADLRPSTPIGYFIVGDERVQVPEIVHNGDSLTFLFSEYSAAMRGRLNGSSWEGKYIRYRANVLSIPFSAIAAPTDTSRTVQDAKPAIPLMGKFRAYLQRGAAVDSAAVATFWMKNDSIFGTVIAPDGDYGLNAGKQSGTSVLLTRFTGWQAQIFELRQDGSSWNGKIYVRDEPPTTLTLHPLNMLPEIIPGGRETKIKESGAAFAFAGITSEGDTLTNLSERFRGKALIVDIMGTWCHNCMDEAPVLQQLYEEYKAKGLEIVGLSFEINDNAELAKKNLRLYQKRFGITFPVLFCGSTEDTYVDQKLKSQLDNFYAYPTSLFIDKRGNVEYIHIGFKGPGTGDEFQAEVQHIYATLKRILR